MTCILPTSRRREDTGIVALSTNWWVKVIGFEVLLNKEADRTLSHSSFETFKIYVYGTSTKLFYCSIKEIEMVTSKNRLSACIGISE